MSINTVSTVVSRLLENASGASFYRADLHIHSYKGSHDVNDQTMTPEAIVETAVAEMVDIIAITDHNSIGNVPDLLSAAKDRILALPGVELSTAQGHLLVYFRDFERLQKYFSSLDIVDSKTSTSRCQNSMLDCLKRVDGRDGFAILAHVDGEKGLEQQIEGYPPHKSDILIEAALYGFEVLSAQSDVFYSARDTNTNRAEIGKKRAEALALGSQQFLARVLFSDAHKLTALGRNANHEKRITRLKMDSPSFDGVALALRDSDARVRLEDEVPSITPYVLGVEMEGGFLPDTRVTFNKNLNCIIGGRGAGKTTLFEAVRSISPESSSNKIVDSEAWPVNLSLVWVDEATDYHTISREVLGEVRNIADPESGPATFPIECYGQGETAEISRRAQDDPGALLAYLDKFVETNTLALEDKEVRDNLLVNQSGIEKADRNIAQIPQYEQALRAARQQAKALEKGKAKEVLALERSLASEREFRSDLEDKTSEICEILKGDPTKVLVEEVMDLERPRELTTGKEQLKVIDKLVKDLTERSKEVTEANTDTAQWFESGVREQLETWKKQEHSVQEKINKKRRELDAQGVSLDMAFIKKVSKDLTEHQKTLNTLAKSKEHRKQLIAERRELLKSRTRVRERISTTREAYAKAASEALGGAMTGLVVSVKYKRDALSPEAEEIVKETMEWRTVQVPRAKALIQILTVPRLLEVVRRKDATAITQLKNENDEKIFSTADAQRIIEKLSGGAVFYSLERCKVEDLPKITVSRTLTEGDGSNRTITRRFSRLSLGQQQSVLLGLMLVSESAQPLIIDQPEDNLDGEFVYYTLVPALRRAKERRQIIVVTHNANIAVLGDAEQIIALKSLSDKGKVVSSGSIDHKKTRDMACTILEGSDEAFLRRARIYGIQT